MARTRSRFVRLAVAAMMAAPLVFATAGPAAAGGGICDPGPPDADGLIGGGTFIGQGIWNTSGNGQEIFVSLAPGQLVNARVVYLNMDGVTHDIVVRSDLNLSTASDFVVKVFKGDRNITEKVFSIGGKRFRNVTALDNITELRYRVKKRATGDPNAELDVFTTGSYEVANFCGDTVRVHVAEPV